MAKGKYKRKQQHAQQKPEERVERTVIMEEEKMAQDETKSATQATNKSSQEAYPFRSRKHKM
jgi:hypothetical protein